MPIMLLKNCKDVIRAYPFGKSTFLLKKFWACISSATYIHKIDSRALPKNYWPISLLSRTIKIFEMNELICNWQHGLRSGRSCLTQPLHHFGDVLESLTKSSDFDSIYLDFANTFNKVDHRVIESFLQNCKEAVVVADHASVLGLLLSRHSIPADSFPRLHDVDRCIMY